MLFVSTLVSIGAHVAFVNWSALNEVHKYFMIGGLTTSFLNHSRLWPRYGSFIDRIVVRSAFCVDAYCTISQKNIPGSILLTCAGLSYLLSKYTKIKYYHVGSHFFGTLAHISIN